MNYLDTEASKSYLDTTKVMFHCDMVSWAHYLDRMAALKSMTPPEDPGHIHASRILSVEEWSVENEWPNEGEEEAYETSATEESQGPGIRPHPDGYYEFLSGVPGLKDWVFHQYDDDFHPSIPHGHCKARSQPKLDPYLGWVYRGSAQIERKSRKVIVQLWNEEDFRVFASIAIEYYLREFPNYRWRVTNPKRLPRRR